MRWARVGMLVIAAGLMGARGEAAPAEETPDAQMLLALDLLTQPEARDRDFMRRMSLFERLRMIELFRMLDETPTAARRPPGAPAAPPGAPPPPPGAPPASPVPATATPPPPTAPAVKER